MKLIKLSKIAPLIVGISMISVSCGSIKNLYKSNPVDVKKLVTISKNHKNILVLFYDAITGDAMSNLIESKPEIKKNLTGFTSYRNSISPTFTNLGIPAIFGGWDFNLIEQNMGIFKDCPNQEVINLAHENMMEMMNKAGYEQSYNDLQYFGGGGWWYNKNTSESKEIVNRAGLNKSDNISITNSPQVNYVFNNYRSGNLDAVIAAKKSIADNLEMKETKKPQFKFIGSESTHPDYSWINKKGEAKIGIGEISNHDNSLETAANILNNTVKKVKSFGKDIYDNTMILFVSDHGNNVSAGKGSGPGNNKYRSKEMQSLEESFNKKQSFKEGWEHSILRSNPTIIVKPFNKNNPFVVNNTNLVSNYDIPQIIENEIKTYMPSFYFNLHHSNISEGFSLKPLTEKERVLTSFDEKSWWVENGNKQESQIFMLRVKNNFYNFKNWEYKKFKDAKTKKEWKDVSSF